MSPLLRLRIKQAIFLAPLVFALLLWLITWPPAIPSYKQVRGAWQPSESWLYDRNGRLLESARVDFSRRRLAWVTIDKIAPQLQASVIAAEDHGFVWHRGVDWLATFGAMRDRLGGKHARGASTLTMQLAGFLAPDLARPGTRGFWEKARQMRAAMAIEGSWSKDEILEAYLNLAGFRGEQQGVMAASQSLFGKPPAQLSPDEAAILTALLPSPQATEAVVARRACAIAALTHETPFGSSVSRTVPLAVRSERFSTSLEPNGNGKGKAYSFALPLLPSSPTQTLPSVSSEVETRPRPTMNKTPSSLSTLSTSPTACAQIAARTAEALGPARTLATDPGLAPHLATKLLPEPGMEVKTTLDSAIQRTAIAALSRQLIGLSD